MPISYEDERFQRDISDFNGDFKAGFNSRTGSMYSDTGRAAANFCYLQPQQTTVIQSKQKFISQLPNS
jgi:hypothetical protein